MSVERLVRPAVILALALGAALPALAQTTTAGAVNGVIRDSSGAAIPGATVRVVNEATASPLEAVSDEQGAYRVGALAAGRYRVEAALDGFETAVRRVALEAGQTVDVDVTLTPAAPHRRRGRHRAPHRGGRAGSADSGVGRRAATWSPTPAPSTSTA